MGRKCAFDRESAVHEALKAFWRDGYEKTSLEDLLKCMGIKTSSFYNSFESKESLFFEALKYYRQSMGRARLNYLTDESLSCEEALLKYFDHLIYNQAKHDLPPGCFMMKTAATLSNTDSSVSKEVSNSIANLLVAAAYGISVLSRTKKSKKELLSTAHALVNTLTSK